MPKLSARTLIVGIVIIVAIAGIAFMMRGGSQNAGEAVPMKNYFNEEYGFTFDYPEGYLLSEHDLEGSAQRKRHVITLIREEDSPAPKDGEGPPAITIQITQNNLDKLTTRQWVEGSADSNFKQSPDQGTASVKVGGMDGLVYRWDGLYQGETTAVATSKWVYAFSVTFNNEDDDIIADYRRIVNSVAYER
jgi:hypothetical protein